ncbi:2OG-Fe(II) oxygenase [Pendulispora rubella]|uniref:2OG-Fe(II) oxygenase n=1 Tax=Pendulispora rubella TaxID=2741070 RepID=A0ABZ2KS81_9BACT
MAREPFFAMAGATTSMEPFRHVVVPEVLRPGAARETLAWLESTNLFARREDPRRRYAQFQIEAVELPAEMPRIRDVLGPESLDDLRGALEVLFGVRFQRRCACLVMRCLAGDSMTIHRDYHRRAGADRYIPTHSFLLYLNAAWRPDDGGELGLFRSEDPADIAVTVAPIHNSGIGIAIGPKSFHAVSPIKQGSRYCINFGFITESDRYQDA